MCSFPHCASFLRTLPLAGVCVKRISKTNSKAAASRVAKIPSEPTGERNRQIYLTLFITVSALWVALPFLTPIAWAAVLAIAEWPLYRRALGRFPGHPTLVAVGFSLATALLIVLPLSLAAVSLAQESQGALDWLKHAQQFGIAAPAWLAGLPLIGGRASVWWQNHIASPQAANTLLGTMSASSVVGWTRSIGSEVAKDFALFLVTLVVLATLLTRGGTLHHGCCSFPVACSEIWEKLS